MMLVVYGVCEHVAVNPGPTVDCSHMVVRSAKKRIIVTVFSRVITRIFFFY